MSYDDYNSGRVGVGGNRNSPDYQQGLAERERRQEQDRQRNTPVPPAPVLPGAPPSSFPGVGSRTSPTVGSTYVAPETMLTMAKSGASLFAVVCVGYLLFQGTWTWVSLAVYTGISALAGGAAGAALYVALKLLVIALKVAGVLLAIGVVLHLMHFINLPAVLGRISASVGL